MTILSAQSIGMIHPIKGIKNKFIINGLTAGLSSCGYDIRVDQDRFMWPGRFCLASSVEEFQMPNNIAAVVHDKSSWIRRGIAVHNTFIEPGWKGFLTLELKNVSWNFINIKKEDPIAQIVFHVLDQPTIIPYQGKYDNQSRGPQPAKLEDL